MGQKSTKSNYKIEQNDKYSQKGKNHKICARSITLILLIFYKFLWKESKSEAGPEEKTKRNELTM